MVRYLRAFLSLEDFKVFFYIITELRQITSYGSIGCINFGCKKQKSTLALLRSLNYYYKDIKMFNIIQGQEGSLESTTVKDHPEMPAFALTSIFVHLLPSSLSGPALSPPQSHSRAQLTTGPATKRNKVVLFQCPNSKFLDTVITVRVMNQLYCKEKMYSISSKYNLLEHELL